MASAYYEHVGSNFPPISLRKVRSLGDDDDVRGSDLYMHVAQGTPGLLWFTIIQNERVVLFLGLNKSLDIDQVCKVNLAAAPNLYLATGSIFESVRLPSGELHLLSVHMYKGVNCSKKTMDTQLTLLIQTIQDHIENVQ